LTHRFPTRRERTDFIFMARLVPLPDDDPFMLEQLWGRKTTPESSPVEVCCVPFFVRDLSLGDTVSLRRDRQGVPLLHRVVGRSGRGTLRVWFVHPTLSRETIMALVSARGGTVEQSSLNYYGVSVDDAAQQQAVEAVLTPLVRDGSLLYEVARAAALTSIDTADRRTRGTSVISRQGRDPARA